MTHTDIAEMIQVLRDLIEDGFTAAALAGLETLQRDVEALATQPDHFPESGKMIAQPEQAKVGEAVARVELMQTGGNAGLATRIVEIDDPLLERLRPGDVLYTRPAPGVPEGFALVPMTEDQVWHNDSIMSANAIGGLKMDAVMRIVRGVEAHHSERLAAAQAQKGQQ